jgi:hypothetical protein
MKFSFFEKLVAIQLPGAARISELSFDPELQIVANGSG